MSYEISPQSADRIALELQGRQENLNRMLQAAVQRTEVLLATYFAGATSAGYAQAGGQWVENQNAMNESLMRMAQLLSDVTRSYLLTDAQGADVFGGATPR